MKVKRAYTPFGRYNLSYEMDNKRADQKKQRLGAISIQDRYLLKKSNKSLTQASFNVEETNTLQDFALKTPSKQSLLPQIDPKQSIRAAKQHYFTGKAPYFKLTKISAKNKLLQQFCSSKGQMREKNNCTFITHEGARIKNQDRISIQEFTVSDLTYKYYAIFDGHGGHLAATYISNNLHLLVKSALSQGLDPSSALKQAILSVEQKFKKNPRLAHKSGSCALVCISHDKQYWVANVGDSRMLSLNHDNQISQITRDHKPQDQSQRRRIQYYGGEVYRNARGDLNLPSQEMPFRVYPGNLSVSRTIGDINLKKNNPNVVIALPDIYHFKAEEEKYLLLFTDGLYEKFTNRQICQFFLSPETNAKSAIVQLYKEAFNRQSRDNRSLIVLQMK